MKVTWKSSGRIHRTIDRIHTVCGYYIGHYVLYKTTKKNKCKTCFSTKKHHKDGWLISENKC